jgi:hypothetical protein
MGRRSGVIRTTDAMTELDLMSISYPTGYTPEDVVSRQACQALELEHVKIFSLVLLARIES